MPKHSSGPAAAAVLSLMFAGTALAGGSHSGGHGHGAKPAIGEPAAPTQADRTVEVIMTDNAYSLEQLKVTPGETVRFVLRNDGNFMHEFTIATAAMHADHRQEMARMMQSSAMQHDHADHGADPHEPGNAVMLKPGETAELTWRFGPAGDMEFACNIPGHYESGMKGAIHTGMAPLS